MQPRLPIRSLAFPLLSLTMAAGPASADVIHVPGDYPTIQNGIEAAADGDVVMVAAGTYTGNGNRGIFFGGRQIELIAPAGPEATTIDCEWEDRGLLFVGGETAASVVDGFRISRGLSPSNSEQSNGGGIYVVNASPTIRNCVVERCWARDAGGGLHVWNPGGEPTTIGNTIFIHNNAGASEYTGHGGAIGVEQNSAIVLTDCEIVDNYVSGGAANNASGGGIFGGALVRLERCRVHFNSAPEGAGGIQSYGALELTDCLITQNWNTGIVSHSAFVNIIGTTISGNRYGGIYATGTSTLTLDRTILWENCWLDEGEEARVYNSSSLTFICSNVDAAGLAGDGEFVFSGPQVYDDPLFCDPFLCDQGTYEEGDYSLDANSPCLPDASPCGELIGAQGHGCGEPVAVEETTIGRIKALYR